MIVIRSILISMDTVIYYFVSICYRLFLILSTINVFNVGDYEKLVQRIYVILGVVMLFILSYSLLKAIVDPDGTEKSEDAPGKIVGKTVTSLILVLVMPVIFEYAYGFQVAILRNNTIGKIILGSPGGDITKKSDDNIALSQQGAEFSMLVYRAFFKANEINCENYHDYSSADDYKMSLDECERNITTEMPKRYKNIAPELAGATGMSLHNAHLIASAGDFSVYTHFAKNVYDQEITHMFPLSLAAGIFLCYVMISFCFDLGIRVAKLAFLQIIAPIPIFARIMPGSAKEIFNNWVKKTTAVFVEVFVRVTIMFFGVYLISIFSKRMWDIITKDMLYEGSFILITFAIVFVIMGILAFIRQAPKLLGELFPGMSSDNMSLGIMNKLGVGGGLAIGAGLGGLATSGVRNFNKSRQDGAGVWKSLGSGVAGLSSGGIRGAKKGFAAKNYAEMKGATHDAVAEVTAKKKERDYYKSRRGDQSRMGYKLKQKWEGVKTWAGAGTDTSLNALQEKQRVYQEGINFADEIESSIGSDERVIAADANFDALKDIKIERKKFKTEAAYNRAMENHVLNLKRAKEQKDIARALAVHEEYQKEGHGKLGATIAKMESWKLVNKNNEHAANMNLDLEIKDSTVVDNMKKSLYSSNNELVSKTLKGLKEQAPDTKIEAQSYLFYNKEFKKASGDVQADINKHITENNPKEG